ncbi:MAG: hypothetical protein PW790_12165 [Parvibaculaceae bacterium]|nr:hypothetical protein [Parvibaculaceae bacterium]
MGNNNLSSTSVLTIFPTGKQPSGAAFSNVESKIFVANTGAPSLSIIKKIKKSDGSFVFSKMDDIPMPSAVSMITCSPTDPVAFIFSQELGETYIFNTSTSQITDTTVGARAFAFSPDGQKVYLNEKSMVLALGPDTSLLNVISPDVDPDVGLAFLPNGRKAYVGGNALDNTGYGLAVIDAINDKQISRITGTGSNFGFLGKVAASNDGKKVYATLESGIIVIDTASDAVVSKIFDSQQFDDIVHSQIYPRLYALSYIEDNESAVGYLYVFDTTNTGRIVDIIQLGASITGPAIRLATDSDGLVYATDGDTNTLTILQEQSL